ncbi:MAG TPA: hypothetical protein VLO07_09285, partial [Thermoanaerobaculia bacterium]|nr:hypothetical protein [Thermoanaerobaculia bacterium]
MGTAAVACAVALSLAGRLWILATRPFWHDETFTLWASRLAGPALLRVLRHDSGPPLFYLLEKPFVFLAEVLGWPDPFARTPPYLAALLLFAAARGLPPTSRRRLLLLLACSPLLALYATEARGYALLALVTLGVFLLTTGVRATPVTFFATASLTALTLYTHYLGLFAVGALTAVSVLEGRRQAAGALLLGSALFVPWVPILLAQPEESTSWMREPFSRSVPGFLSALGGVGRIPTPLGGPLPQTLFWAGTAVGLVLFACLVAAAGRDPEIRGAVLFAGLTLSAILVVSLWRPVAFAGRSEMAVLPVWVWAVAKAGERRRPVRFAAAAAMALGVCASLLLLVAPRGVPAPARATAFLARCVHGGDTIFAATQFYLPALLASDRGEITASVHAFPRDLERHPGWFATEPPSESDERSL